MLENETEENVLEWKRILKFIIISSNFRSCHTFCRMMGSLSCSSSMTIWGSCEYALLKWMSAFCTLIPPNENNTFTTYKHTQIHQHTHKYIHVYTYNWYSQCTTALFIVVCCCCCSHHKRIDLYGSAHKMTQFICAMGFCFNLIASIFIFSLLWMGYGCEYDVSHCPLCPIHIHVPLASYQGCMQTTCDNEMPFEQMSSISAFRIVLISVGDSHVLFCLMDFSSLRKNFILCFHFTIWRQCSS